MLPLIQHHAALIWEQICRPTIVFEEDIDNRTSSYEIIDYHTPYPDMFVDHVRRANRLPPSPQVALSANPGLSAGTAAEYGSTATQKVTEQAPAAIPTANPADPLSGIDISFSLGMATLERFSKQLRSVHRKYITNPLEHRSSVVHYGLYVIVGIGVGIVASLVSTSINVLEQWRGDSMVQIVEGASARGLGFIAGLLFWIASASGFALIATGVVCLFEPAASGSGIPQVMAYLNGVLVGKVLNIRTFIAKFISVIAAVAGGLPVGAEAPLIQLGAIVGAGLTQGRSRTLGCQTSLFRAFRSQKDRRDFVTAGAACGVSAAFGAPIGGLLFVMEEVASFFGLDAAGQAFLASLVSFFTVAFFNYLLNLKNSRGYVSSNAVVLLGVENVGTTPLNISAIVPAAILGALAGLAAVAFTRINIGVVRWRNSIIRPHLKYRMMEPVLIAALFAAVTYTLPLVAPCVPIVTVVDAAKSLNQSTSMKMQALEVPFKSSLSVGSAPMFMAQGSGSPPSSSSVSAWHTEDNWALSTYLCANRTTHYSPLATLMTAVGKPSIRHLLSRQTTEEFSAFTVTVFVLCYFTFAAYINGAAMATGMVVPMLVIGSGLGRLFGLALVSLFGTIFEGSTVTSSGTLAKGLNESQNWMDPGVFALIGAAAFFGGVSRMTISLTVIMVELSGELHYLLPIMIAITVAKHTADALCPPLYHALLHLDAVPYLPIAVENVPMEAFTVQELLWAKHAALPPPHTPTSPNGAPGFKEVNDAPLRELPTALVTLRLEESIGKILDALSGTTHNCFPVVVPRHVAHNLAFFTKRPTSLNSSQERSESTINFSTTADGHNCFVGTVARDDLQVLLTLYQEQHQERRVRRRNNEAEGRSSEPLAASVNGTRTEDEEGPTFRVQMTYDSWLEYQASLFFVSGSRTWHSKWTTAAVSQESRDIMMDLSLIVNRSPWTVTAGTRLSNAFQLFRSNALRHLIVIESGAAVGILTRNDLLPHLLRRRLMLERRRRVVPRAGEPNSDDDVEGDEEEEGSGYPRGGASESYLSTAWDRVKSLSAKIFSQEARSPRRGNTATTDSPTVVASPL